MINFELFKEFVSLYDDTNVLYYPDRYIRIIHEEYLNNGLAQLPVPLFATWDVTEKCNLSCGFCSASSKHCSNSLIDSPNSLAIANEIIKYGIKYISLRGGEPSLIIQLPYIVKMFLDSGMFVEIVSNGTNINQKFFDVIKNSNLRRMRIKISIDSHNQSTNDYMRGIHSYCYATRAMEVCLNNNFRFRSQMVLTSLNLDDIEDTYNLVNTKGASSFAVMIVLPMGRGREYKNRVELNDELLKSLIGLKKRQKNTIIEKIGIGMEAMKYYEIFNNKTVDGMDEDKIRMLKCNGGKSRIYINPYGTLYPCEMLQFPEFKLGNILCDDLDSVWRNDILSKFNSIRRKTLIGCANCKNKVCDTGCYGIYYEGCKKGNGRPNCES